MVIVHGTPDASRHLAEFCRDSKDMGVSQIFVPGIGETVDATSERHIYQVRLSSKGFNKQTFYYCICILPSVAIKSLSYLCSITTR